MRNAQCKIWNMAKKLKIVENRQKNTAEPGIWRDTLKNVENEKYSRQDLEYGEKTEKRGK